MGPRGRGADRSDFGSNGSNAVLPVGLTVAFGACLDDDRGICIPGAEDQEALLQPWQLLQSDKDRYIRGHAVIGPTLHFEDRHVRCDDRDKQPRFAGLAWPGSAVGNQKTTAGLIRGRSNTVTPLSAPLWHSPDP